MTQSWPLTDTQRSAMVFLRKRLFPDSAVTPAPTLSFFPIQTPCLELCSQENSSSSEPEPEITFTPFYMKKKSNPCLSKSLESSFIFLGAKSSCYFPSSNSKINQYLPFSDKFPSVFVDGFERKEGTFLWGSIKLHAFDVP